jgi:hypothetical protein
MVIKQESAVLGEFFGFKYIFSEKSPYFRVLRNKYEEDDYEEFESLILVIFLDIPRIIFLIYYF